MSISKALNYIFRDPNFTSRVVTGALIWLSAGFTFSLTGFILSGYGLEIARQVIKEEDPQLPPWTNIGKMFGDGFMWLFIMLPYVLIPTLPFILIGLMIMSASSADFVVFIAYLVIAFAVVAEIAGAMCGFAALGHYAATGQFSNAFHVGEIVSLVKNNLGTYLSTTLINLVGFFVILLVGTLACGIGLFAAGPIAVMFQGHIIGQAYVKARGSVSAPAVSAGAY